MKLCSSLLLALIVAGVTGCGQTSSRTVLSVQRFFGECRAHVPKDGAPTANADGECEIITHLLDSFAAQNPDIDLRVNQVAWPGYDQLSAQLAAGDAPDVVTMHLAVIPDYEHHHLLEPMDEELAAAHIAPQAFTDATRQAVTLDGHIYGMPFDTWTQLWHINLNLFAKAGLIRDGQPVLPRSPAEMLAQARQFRARTGKPYFVWSTVNEKDSFAWTLYTYLLAQDAIIFPDPRHICIDTPQASAVVDLFREIYAEGLATHDQDYSTATQSFINGDGGVYLVGTWLIGAFTDEARKPGRPLYKGYTVRPYPVLFGDRPGAYVDGHAWVMPKRERTVAERQAAERLLGFLAAHEEDWTRSGHLSSLKAVIASPEYRALPHKQDLLPISGYGRNLPNDVQRQFAIESIVGEEVGAAITGQKATQTALKSAQARVNELLYNLI